MSGYLQLYGMFPICCGCNGTSTGSSTPTGPAGGSLSGTYPNPTLANTGVTAGTYGSASQIPVFIVNSAGQLTSVTNTPVSITSSQISDLGEAVQDIVGSAFIDSANIDFTYNDPGNTITADLTNTTVVPGTYTNTTITVDQKGRITSAVNGSGASVGNTDGLPEGVVNLYFTNERAQDAVGNILLDSANIDFTYNDAGNTITADLTNTGVTAGTYGSASNIPVITLDSKGRVTTIIQTPASSTVTNPGGSNTQIQFNNAGVFGGSPNLVFDPTTNRVGLGTATPTAKQDIAGQSNEVQLKVRANSTQTNDILQVQDSTGQNQLTIANNGSIELGSGGVATEPGQLVHANGNFASPGDAQTSEYPLRVATSTGSPTLLSIDGASGQITIPTNKTIVFSGIVGARSSTGNSAYWEVRGAIKNNAGTTSLIGSPLVSYIASDPGASTWNAGNIYSAITISANDTNDSLGISVTGESGVNIRWNSFIKTVEIGF